MANLFSRHISIVTYFLICSIISLPFNYANFQLLYQRDGIPAGSDSTFHIYSVLKMLDTNNPLITYAAFPSLVDEPNSFYPSFMQATISLFAKMAAVDPADLNDSNFVIEEVKLFMLSVSIAGTIGYALLIRTILDKLIGYKIRTSLHHFCAPGYGIIYLAISLLAFGIFIFSVSPILKTFNDGTYGELFAMWAVFPYYIYLLLNNRWIISPVLLAIIASSHNLAFLMSLSATIPYIISSLLQKRMRLKTDLVKFAAIFIILAAPALVLFYLPVTTGVMQGKAVEAVYIPLSMQTVVERLAPGLYYAGLISMGLALVINRRVLGWIVGWALIYFLVIGLSSVIGERFLRELSAVFGLLVGVCVAYLLFMTVLTGKTWFIRTTVKLNNSRLTYRKAILIFVISATIIPLVYFYFQDRIAGATNPILTKYFTETFEESNKYFLTLVNGGASSSTGDKQVIALFGVNPWLKVTTYGNFEVLEVGPVIQKSDSLSDMQGNRELRLVEQITGEIAPLLTSPDTSSTACTIKKYDIDYIYISNKLAGRWYGTLRDDLYFEQLRLFQTLSRSPIYDLEKEFFGEDGEHLRIFTVNKEYVDRVCE